MSKEHTRPDQPDGLAPVKCRWIEIEGSRDGLELRRRDPGLAALECLYDAGVDAELTRLDPRRARSEATTAPICSSMSKVYIAFLGGNATH
jgi:hypothetical protein